jgi:hypothetical protein
MRGLHIPTPDRRDPGVSGSHFERLFGFLIQGLASHRWLIDTTGYAPFLAWSALYDDDDPTTTEWLRPPRCVETSHGWLVDTPFLLRFMGDLTDEIDLFGFSGPEIDLSSWEDRRTVHDVHDWDRTIFRPDAAELVFSSVDGAFWEFFSDRTDLVDEVARRWPEAAAIELA